MKKKDRIYIARDRRLDEIGIPINPHFKRDVSWWVDWASIPEVMAIVVVILVLIVYLIVKLLS